MCPAPLTTCSRSAPLASLRSKKPAAAASTPPAKDGNNFRARRLSVSDIDTSEFEKAAKGTPSDGTKKGRRLSMRCAPHEATRASLLP